MSGKPPVVFYAWELGTQNGHAGPFSPLAQALTERDVLVFSALRETRAGALLLSKNCRYMQAPFASERNLGRNPYNYADILLSFGYHEPLTLTGLVASWRELFLLSKADLVLADHSPTAILAARTLNIPVMMFGSGFSQPPLMHPLPCFRPWDNISSNILERSDVLASQTINTVLQHFACPPLGKLADLFQVAESALLTFPELDHYADRGKASYWGALPYSSAGTVAKWPLGEGRKRVFAYVHNNHPQFNLIIDLLGKSACAVVLYSPGLVHAALPANIHLSEQPLELASTLAEADVVLLNGGLATSTAALLAGKPLLLLPTTLEQYLLAMRVQSMGAGLFLLPNAAEQALRESFAGLLENPAFSRAAQQFSVRYAAYKQSFVIDNLWKRISAFL